ncbi:metalloprotease TldD [Pseudomonas sp. 21TX0197]|uniref:metalloprotease TldD n=1 Tax=Pseudomonas TaxID=286 RepID=UPI000D3C66A1|nr:MULTISPECIES: metalloprotease TldD [Pseudomonas]VVN97761.1 Metalloprotease TldD [Pseudomonas fluorescens]MCR8662934.1 metalloprotease TldD [Pseudomonas carnis]MDB6445250.1 metalloprotease TldD [Pseudomonas sp. 21TX0197]MDI3251135.1 metalloprotease TldD [Pseudomonas sp. AL10]MDI3267208.1 metalloprotease TldD [Pseudomonas sp. AL15]
MSHSEVNHLSIASEILLAPNSLDLSDIHRAFASIHEHKVDYADLYLQSIKKEDWSMENGVVQSGSYSVDQGFGLRALHTDETAFAYSQVIDAKQLMSAARSVRNVAAHGDARIALNNASVSRLGLYGHDDPLQACDAAEKISLLESVDRKARARDPRVSKVMAHLHLSHSIVMIMRNDGRLAADVRPMLVLQMRVFVNQNGRMESSSGRLGGRSDFNLFNATRLDEEIRRLVDAALTNLEAEAAPVGSMPVVIAPGWPGMLLHEAMGHGFEGDFNRMGTSIYADKIGERVAAPGVNIVDDATLMGRRGSLHIDDEGEPGQRTTLIEDGILKGYMHDSLNARLMGHASTGNARRESYSHLPMPRMTNTFMLNGEFCPEEIISTVKRGLYLANLGSGQVDIVSGQFTFESELAFLIEDGRITRPVKGATLTGSGPDTLKVISMIGNDLALDNGGATCGKSGQSVPVCVGQPTLKIDRLIVGGTA